ncbi:MAG TPA: hypothetical protein VFX03_11615, partial [Thermomicrobiales bacterium]|nr:hypothetical protein [Thermomicrobiales bacterium]
LSSCGRHADGRLSWVRPDARRSFSPPPPSVAAAERENYRSVYHPKLRGAAVPRHGRGVRREA